MSALLHNYSQLHLELGLASLGWAGQIVRSTELRAKSLCKTQTTRETVMSGLRCRSSSKILGLRVFGG